MTVTRAKFSCRKIKKECGRYKILFYSTSLSVSGQIGLNTASLPTAEQFKVGHDYYVDFTEVPESK